MPHCSAKYLGQKKVWLEMSMPDDARADGLPLGLQEANAFMASDGLNCSWIFGSHIEHVFRLRETTPRHFNDTPKNPKR